METTTTTPTTTNRKTIQEIVQIAKDRALIEIVTNGKSNIEQAFVALKVEADQLKGFDKTYVPPWEIVPKKQEPENPLALFPKKRRIRRMDSNYRVYQVRNCRDALLKILDTDKPMSIGAIIQKLNDLGLTYKESTIRTCVSQFDNHNEYFSTKHDGWGIRWQGGLWKVGECINPPGYVKFQVKLA